MRISPKTTVEQLDRRAARLKILNQLLSITIEEASDICGCNRKTIEDAINKGELAFITMFGGVRIWRQELDAWHAKNQIVKN